MSETLHHKNSTLKLPHSVGHTDHKTDRHEHTSSVSGGGKQGKLCITKKQYLPVAYTYTISHEIEKLRTSDHVAQPSQFDVTIHDF